MTIHTLSAVGTAEVLAPHGHSVRSTSVRRSLGSGARGALDHLTDVAAVVAALLLVSAGSGSLHPGVVVAVAVAWPLAVAVSGAHRLNGVPGTTGPRVRAVLRAGAGFGLGCWVLDTVVRLPVEPLWLLLLAASVTTVSAAGRLATAVAAARTSRLLVVGHDPEVTGILRELADVPDLEPVAVCSLDDALRSGFTSLPLYRGLGAVADAAAEHHADAVLVLPSPRVTARDLQRLGWWLAPTGAHLYVGTGLRDVSPERTSFARVGGLRLLHLRSVPVRGVSRLGKEAGERLAAGLALVLLLPALVAIAVAVRTGSPGPALFRQERVGRDGRPFTMLKFRTMRVAAESEVEALSDHDEGAGVLFKIRNDPRITRFGGFLRRYSLDELPQLVNVVRGDMALVGPRPALPQEVARYDGDPRRRLAVKPGLTGLWQVSGRSDLSWEDSVRLDLAYVDNWSLALDLRIVLRTFGAVLGHRGAY